MKTYSHHRKLFSLLCVSLFLLCLCLQPANNFSSVHASTDNPISENTLVYRSLDGGASWSSFAESGQGLRASRVNKVVVDPTNFNIFYLATDQGIFKSIDGGNTWQHLKVDVANFSVVNLIIDPVHSNNLYFTNDFFYRSQDGGHTWEKRQLIVDPPLTNDPANTFLHATCIAIDPINPANIYIGARGAEYVGIFKSTNGGNTFRFNYREGSIEMRITQIDIGTNSPATVYYYYEDTRDSGAWKSLNGGETFIKRITDSEYDRGTFLVDVQHPSNLYISGRDGFFRSLDAGGTWTQLDRVSLVAIDNFSTIYGRRGVNLVKSVDGAVTFTDTNFDRKFISLGFDPNNPAVIYATTSVIAFYGPKINSISVDGKNLVITASDVREGGTVWVDYDAQVTKVSFEQSLATLTAKKAYKRIRPGQTVSVRIIDGDGYASNWVSFTRPQ